MRMSDVVLPKTRCCESSFKADPKSNKNWMIPRCSKCGSTKIVDIFKDGDFMRWMKKDLKLW